MFEIPSVSGNTSHLCTSAITTTSSETISTTAATIAAAQTEDCIIRETAILTIHGESVSGQAHKIFKNIQPKKIKKNNHIKS